MKTSSLLAAAALSLLAVTGGAHAESYDGVHVGVSALSRETVATEAVRTAAAPDQNVSSGSRVNSKVISTMTNAVDARASASRNGAPAKL